MRPLQDWVVVLPDTEDQLSAGGLLLPTMLGAELDTGTVLAVGPGSRDEDGDLRPTQVKAGQRVVFDFIACQDVTMADGRAVKLTRERDLMGVCDG